MLLIAFLPIFTDNRLVGTITAGARTKQDVAGIYLRAERTIHQNSGDR